MKKCYLTFAVALIATASFAQKSLVERKGAPQFLQTPAPQAKAIKQGPVFEGRSLERLQEVRQKLDSKLATARKAPARVKDPNIISEQPAGELKHNLYGYHIGFFSFYGGAYRALCDGLAEDVVFAEDGSVYIKNPMSTLVSNTWLKGTLSADGQSVTVTMPQPVYYQAADEDSETEELNLVAWKCNYEKIEDPDYGSYYWYMPETTDNTVTFTLKNDTLTYDSPEMSIIGLCDSEGSWYGYGDYYKVYFPCGDVVAQPAADATVKEYVLTHVTDDTDADSITTDAQIVKVYKDDKGIYLHELGGKDDDVYVKATQNGNTYTIADNQYLGVPDESSYHLFTKTLAWKPTYNEWYDTYSDSTYFSNNDFTLTYDPASDTYTGENNYLSINNGQADLYTAVSFKKPVLTPYVKVEAAPVKPVIQAAVDYSSEGYTYGYIIFGLTHEDADGNFLNTNNIYYNILLETDGEESVYEFCSDDYYYQTVDVMTDVPYTYYDSFDLYAQNNLRQIYIYTVGYDKIGVQEFYKGDDGTVYPSEKAWYDLAANGIQSAAINDNAEKVASISYYDLNGCKVSKPQQGVYVKNITYADGSTKAQKVVMK